MVTKYHWCSAKSCYCDCICWRCYCIENSIKECKAWYRIDISVVGPVKIVSIYRSWDRCRIVLMNRSWDLFKIVSPNRSWDRFKIAPINRLLLLCDNEWIFTLWYCWLFIILHPLGGDGYCTCTFGFNLC